MNLDDNIHIYDNPYITLPSLSGTLRLWTRAHQSMYIPLTFTVWLGVASLSRMFSVGIGPHFLDPRLFHLLNLTLHLLNVLLVYVILKALIGSVPVARGRGWEGEREKVAAALGALLFSLHPVQVEPVIWLSSLKDLLCGFWSLAALWLFLRFAGWEACGKYRGKGWAISATGCFILACFAKPAAVVVPLLAVLLLTFRSPRSRCGWRGRFLLSPPHLLALIWLVIAIPFMIAAKVAEGDINLDLVAPLWSRLFIAADAVGFYLGLLFFPWRLGVDYGQTIQVIMGHSWFYFAWLIPVGLVISLWLQRDRRQWLVSLAVFVTCFLPTVGLIPHGFQNFSTVADRFLYMAMLGPALALAWLLCRYRKRVVIVTGAVIVMLLGVRSIYQRRVWINDVSLCQHTLQLNPNSYYAHDCLGLALVEQGMVEKALPHYRRAIQIKPNYPSAYNNLGVALARQGKYEEALPYFKLVVTNRPEQAEAHNNLGAALARLERYEEAVFHYRSALQLKFAYPMAHYNLGIAMEKQGRYEEACAQFEEVIRLQPDFASACEWLRITRAKADGITEPETE
ncbi:MAG: tetratricopeptide repeat protein [Candidatus Euphemobacter frigidus]|nr:tetratricopeptide repeat protein [Candidatus Euphemobacter frigidus]MDP8276771.1 tetratricopeptide repeat protein [Candidatus Euphemobacter frigidus]